MLLSGSSALAKRLTAKVVRNNDEKAKVVRHEDLISSQAVGGLWAKVSARIRYKLEFTDAEAHYSALGVRFVKDVSAEETLTKLG